MTLFKIVTQHCIVKRFKTEEKACIVKRIKPMLVNILLKRFAFTLKASCEKSESVKAKRFNKMFTSILVIFFLLRIANRSHFYAPKKHTVCSDRVTFALMPTPRAFVFVYCYLVFSFHFRKSVSHAFLRLSKVIM